MNGSKLRVTIHDSLAAGSDNKAAVKEASFRAVIDGLIVSEQERDHRNDDEDDTCPAAAAAGGPPPAAVMGTRSTTKQQAQNKKKRGRGTALILKASEVS